MFRMIGVVVLTAMTVSCTTFPRSDVPSAAGNARNAWERSLPYLDAGLARIGRNRASVELPQGYEVAYSMIGRVPMVDEALRNPLAMPFWTIDLAERVARGGGATPALIGCAAGALGAPARRRAIAPDGVTPRSALTALVSHQDLRMLTDRLSPATVDTLGFLLAAIREASTMREEALSRLDPAERKQLVDACRRFFLVSDPGAPPQLKVYTDSLAEKLAVAALARKVRIDRLVDAAILVAEHVERLRAILRDAPPPNETFSVPTPLGRIIIGGTGDDVHDAVDTAILIEFGGNDRYVGGAGSSADVPAGVSVCVDLSGDDLYDSGGRDLCQGAGVAGVGILVDESGDDRYRAGQYSQGSGCIGVGMLLDNGGADDYAGDIGCQGAGIFGVGLLSDTSGDDKYHVELMGQGFSSTMGMGLLCDHRGNDRYTAGGIWEYQPGVKMSCAQGFSFGTRGYPWYDQLTLYGGVAALVDLEGNDEYTIGASGQGAAYVFGLGMLFDGGGNDVYSAADFSTGSGTHLAAGVFVDAGGDDVYNGAGHSMGWSLDRSQAVFLDVAGNDKYTKAGCAYSGKPKSVAFFVDFAGDDVYTGSSYCGEARPPERVDWRPVAVFADLGGNDSYVRRNAGNDREWVPNPDSYGIDTTAGKAGGVALLEGNGEDDAPFLHPEIASGNIFTRYFGEGLYLSETPASLARLFAGGKRSVRRAAEDIASARHIAGTTDATWIDPLGRTALVSRDPETRRYIVEFLGRIDDPEAVACLRKMAMTDDHPLVLSYVLQALARRDPGGTVRTAEGFLSSPDARLRRAAVSAIGESRSGAAGDLLYPLRNDADEGVRCAAASAFALIPDNRAEVALREQLKDESGYVREAAAYALIQRGNAEGIGELIRVLRNPNWVAADAAHRMLAQATNQAFDGKNIEGWERWWGENRTTFSLERYAGIKDLLSAGRKALFDRRYEDAVRAYEQALGKWPDHRPTRDLAAEALDKYAWHLITTDRERRDPRKAIELAGRALEFRPNDAGTLDTLAEAYAQTGAWEDALAARKRTIEIAPQNKRFHERLRWLERERGKQGK